MVKLNRGAVVYLLALVLVSSFAYANFAQMTNSDGPFNSIGFDRKFLVENMTLSTVDYEVYSGSESYFLNRFGIPRISLELCHENLSSSHYLDLAYFNYDQSLVEGLFNLPQKIINLYVRNVTQEINGSNISTELTCTNLFMDLAVRKAFYPGSLVPIIYIPENGTKYDLANMSGPDYILPELDKVFDGSYKVNIKVLPPSHDGITYIPKKYAIFTEYAYDEKNVTISYSADYLMTSVIDSNGSLIITDQLSQLEYLEFDQSFSGGEVVLINDLPSLELKVYDPCTPLESSGYYILNGSQFDINETCVVIDNISNVVLNFVGEILSGNNASVNLSDNTTFENSSLAPGVCSIRITNSQNISLESIKTQQFHTGICIENSSVNIFGEGTTFNLLGANITGGSVVQMHDITFSNIEAEMIADENSTVLMELAQFATAKVKTEFQNIIIHSVFNPPPPPAELNNDTFSLGQYIQYTNTTKDNSWAKIAFYYNETIPFNLSMDNVSVWKYNGTYAENILIGTGFNNLTNTTDNIYNSTWVNGTWKQYPVLVSPLERTINVVNTITQFSVFAPFSNLKNTSLVPEPEPEPEPKPKPKPKPSSGSGGGGGSVPAKPDSPDETEYDPELLLELELPDEVIIHQGEVYRVPFNLSNVGNITAFNLTVIPRELFSWDIGSTNILELPAGEIIHDDFLITPDEKALAREYYIPIYVNNGNGNSIVTEILKVVVIPRSNLTRIRMLEYPRVLEIFPSSREKVSFLVENMGGLDLENVRVEIKDNNCLEDVTGKNNILSYGTEIISYSFYAKDGVESCSVNVMFYNQEGVLVGFAPIEVKVTNTALPVDRVAYMLLIVAIWTAITAMLIMRRFNSNS